MIPHAPTRFRLRYLFIALALLAVGSAMAVSCRGPAIPKESQWMSHVRALADDALEGRGTGTRGMAGAADYVARELEKYGVHPAGDSATYFQRVPFLSRRVREEECSLALVRGRRVTRLKFGEDAVLSMKPDHAPKVDARLVFVGHGLHVPELGYSDLEGVNLKGAIAVFVYGTPKRIRGPRASHASYLDQRWAAFRAAGAVGMIRISSVTRDSFPWERFASGRFEPSLVLDGRAFDETPGARISMFWNPNRAAPLFKDARYSWPTIRKIAREGRQLPRFELPYRLRATVASEVRPIECRNVVAMIEGSDKKLRDEVVVLSGHLDHLGISTPVEGDSIYNGAMDNASGCATLLEMARMIRRSGHAPKRSLLFLFTTGEESGLLGARYFAARPTVGKRRLVANLNIDMFLPIRPIRGITAYGIDESELGDDARKVAKAESLKVIPDPAPERNYFVRSDQYPFIRRGIPALMIDAGPVDSAGRAAEAAWNKKHYHQPSDDAVQDIDLGAVARYDRYVVALTRQVADRKRAPRWHDDSYFKRFAKK
jgi:hypothetical protein